LWWPSDRSLGRKKRREKWCDHFEDTRSKVGVVDRANLEEVLESLQSWDFLCTIRARKQLQE